MKLIKFLAFFLILFFSGYKGLEFYLVNPVLVKSDALKLAQSQRLKKTVYHIVSEFTPRSYKNIENLNKTADFIFNTLREYNYNPIEQNFQVKDDISDRYKQQESFQKYNREFIEKQNYKNIITRIGPLDQPKIVIGAHYDVCHELPGADDNTSGVAGLLELARLLKQKESQLKFQVELVFFTLEEPPYFRSPSMGSYHHSQMVKNDDVRLMISLEMIGYFVDQPQSQNFPLGILKEFYSDQGNFIALIGKVQDWGFTRKVKSYFQMGSPLKIFSLNAPASLVGIDFSDHMNYWKVNIPALMVTDTAFYRNHQYHEKGDTPVRLDYDKMAQVVDGILSVILNFE